MKTEIDREPSLARPMSRRAFSGGLALSYASITQGRRARATSPTLRVGVLTDMSGYSADQAGPGSVLAAQMAVEDFGKVSQSRSIEVLSADHQHKPDIGATIARKWCDEGVDILVNVNNSAVALAVSTVVQHANRVLLATGPGTTRLTGDACAPTTVHWTFDNWALAHGTAMAVLEGGDDTWSFLTTNFAFGIDLEDQASRVVEAGHGSVLARVRVPPQAPDFSSYLFEAQSSRAKVIAFAMTAGDLQNALKQAAEFGITRGGQHLACLLAYLTDIHGLGLEATQGLKLTASFYWNLNPDTRAWSLRFSSRQRGGARPTMTHAGDYAAVLHALKAIDKIGASGDGRAVVAAMKAMPTRDPLFGSGIIRADGRKIHDMYLFQVKTPAELSEPWDYYKLVTTIPAAKAFRPMVEGGCTLPT